MGSDLGFVALDRSEEATIILLRQGFQEWLQ
jgi:hypothetical protein